MEYWIQGYKTYDPDANLLTDPVSTTLSVVAKGQVFAPIAAYNGCTIDVNGNPGVDQNSMSYAGGKVSNGITLFDDATLNVSEKGSVYGVDAEGRSHVNVTGNGSVAPNVPYTIQTAPSGVKVGDHATALLNGGTINSADAAGYGTINFTGGTITHDLYAEDHSTVTVSGQCTVSGSCSVKDGATMLIASATVGGAVSAFQGGQVTVNGGTVGSVGSSGNGLNFSVSAATVTGATVTGDVSATAVSGADLCHTYVNGATVNGGATVGGAGATLYLSNGTTVAGQLAASNGGVAYVNAKVGGANITGGTVNVSSGAEITQTSNVSGTGHLVVSDGEFDQDVVATGQAVVAITGGNVGSGLGNHSTVYAQGNSLVTLGGGSAYQAVADDSATFAMTGGSTSYLFGRGTGIINFSGGTNSYSMTLNGASSAFLTGGQQQETLITHDTAFADISGSTVGGVQAHDSSTVYLHSGTVLFGLSGVQVYDNARFIWSGGKVLSTGVIHNTKSVAADGSTPVPIYLYGNGALQIQGINLKTVLVDPGAQGGAVSQYQLTGYLADGTAIPAGSSYYVENAAAGGTPPTVELDPSVQTWSEATGAGSWSNAVNWQPGVVADGAGAMAEFTDPGQAETVTFDGDHSVGKMTIHSADAYTIAAGTGGTLTLDNKGQGAEIDLIGGHHEIDVPVVAHDDVYVLAVNDFEAGLLEPGSVKLTQGLTVAAGRTVSLYGGGTVSSAFVRGGAVDIEFGTVAILPNGTSAGASRVDALTVGPGGTLDLADNSLMVHHASLAGVRPLVQSGYADGSWTGTGLTSSVAAATPGRGLAAFTGAEFKALHPGSLFGGGTVADDDVLIEYGLLGDATLDGTVDFNDFLALQNGFGADGDYVQGDFNDDGVVDFNDFLILQNNFGTALNAASVVFTAEQYAAVAAFGLSHAVPEPASLGMIGLCLAAAGGGRRRGASRCQAA